MVFELATNLVRTLVPKSVRIDDKSVLIFQLFHLGFSNSAEFIDESMQSRQGSSKG